MHKKRSKLSYYFKKYVIIPLKIFRIAIIDTVRQDGIEHAGYLAFLSLLSLFPFLIFLIAIIAFFGATETASQMVHAIISAAPKEVAEGLLPRIDEIVSGPPQSFLTIAIIGVIWTASSSVEGCRTILNRAYRVAFPPPYILRRFFSILQFFVIILIMVAAVVAFVSAPAIIQSIQNKFHFTLQIDYEAFHLRHIFLFVLLTFATSILYFALPNAKQKITQTVPGSILVVIMWLCLEKIFSIYLNHFHQFNMVYGSLAGVIISLMFFYLISMIFIFGAEFNYHFHRTYQVFLKKKTK